MSVNSGSYCHLVEFVKLLANCGDVPAIGVTRPGLREGGIMRTKLQGAVIAVLEEGLAVDPKEFFHLLSRDPSWMLGHD